MPFIEGGADYSGEPNENSRKKELLKSSFKYDYCNFLKFCMFPLMLFIRLLFYYKNPESSF